MKTKVIMLIVVICIMVMGCNPGVVVKLSRILNENQVIVIQEDKQYLVSIKEISDKELRTLLQKNIQLVYELTTEGILINRYLASYDKNCSIILPSQQ